MPGPLSRCSGVREERGLRAEQLLLPEVSQKNQYELGTRVLRDLFTASMRSLMDAMGPDVAVEAVRPLFRYLGMQGAWDIRTAFRIEGEELSDVAMTLALDHLRIGVGEVEVSVGEEYARLTYRHCPFAEAPMEACLVVCQNVSEGACRSFDEELQVDTCRMMKTGDPECSKLIKLDDAVEIRPGQDTYSPLHVLDTEGSGAWDGLAYDFMLEAWLNVLKVLIAFNGREGADRLVEARARGTGTALGRVLLDRSGMTGGTAEAAGLAVHSLRAALGIQDVVVEEEGCITLVQLDSPFTRLIPSAGGMVEALQAGIVEAVSPACTIRASGTAEEVRWTII